MPPRLKAVDVVPVRRPNRTSANGTIRFDRDLTRMGVGRIQISSGTDKPDEFDRRNGIITKLVEDGDVDTLRALKSGEISIQEVVTAWKRGRLDTALDEARAARGAASRRTSAPLRLVAPAASAGSAPDLDLATRLGLMLLERLGGSSSAVDAVGGPEQVLAALLRPQVVEPSGVSGAPARDNVAADVAPASPVVAAAPTPIAAAPLAGPHMVTVHGSGLPYAEEERPLWATLIDRVIPALECGPETRRRYATSLESLRRKMRQYTRDEDLEKLQPTGGDDATPIRYDQLAVEVFHGISGDGKVGDLRRVNKWFWMSLERQWGGSDADWNHMRRGLAAALTGLFGGDAQHPFRQAIIKAIPMRDEGEGRMPDITVEQFWQIVDHLPEHMKAVPVVLVATGMRMKEYRATRPEQLKPNTYAVQVPGTKNNDSKGTVMVAPEIWPWIEAGVPAPHRYKRLWQYWTEACAKAGIEDLRLHDLRHCLGQWSTDAGVPEKYVQWALRHRDPNMTRRYTRTAGKRVVATAMGKVLQRP